MADDADKAEKKSMRGFAEAESLARELGKKSGRDFDVVILLAMRWLSRMPPELVNAVLAEDLQTSNTLLLSWVTGHLQNQGIKHDTLLGMDYPAILKNINLLLDEAKRQHDTYMLATAKLQKEKEAWLKKKKG